MFIPEDMVLRGPQYKLIDEFMDRMKLEAHIDNHNNNSRNNANITNTTDNNDNDNNDTNV